MPKPNKKNGGLTVNICYGKKQFRDGNVLLAPDISTEDGPRNDQRVTRKLKKSLGKLSGNDT